MSNIWLTSDWHFCHSQPFIYEPRGFKNQYEMNQTIIKNYNSVVQPNDDVYCVGDCILNDNEEGIKCIKQLKGKIHIVIMIQIKECNFIKIVIML
jgi:calcineurin-like phosphoesterase family protein